MVVAMGSIGVLIFSLLTPTAYAKSAPLAEDAAIVAVKPVEKNVRKARFSCKNNLARTLHSAGFRGENLHEAWAIAMRESNGIPTQVSNGSDFGLFQFNYPSHGRQSWWSSSRLLNGEYNASIAFKISRGGKDWSQWGMDGHGNTNAYLYRNYGWSEWQIDNWITKPYQKYYQQYPCK